MGGVGTTVSLVTIRRGLRPGTSCTRQGGRDPRARLAYISYGSRVAATARISGPPFRAGNAPKHGQPLHFFWNFFLENYAETS